MKKSIFAIALTSMIILSSCGDSDTSNFESAGSNAKSRINSIFDTQSIDSGNKSDSVQGEMNNKSAGEADFSAENQDSDQNTRGDDTAEAMSYKQSAAKAIDTQMLVYSCNMDIDVLEFDESVDKFHGLIDKYKGFIENETYTDGGSSTKWQYTNEEKWKILNATIRIPSADYYNFCDDIKNIGDLRRKDASVENLNSEYSDLKTTLSIYEAKEKRYLDILKDITSESEAVSIENELTDIQVEIAKIKTRMNNIENDVAYSYIRLTINEVREYTEEPVIEKTDTFLQRLSNTVSKTAANFLSFLEDILFILIKMLPYLVFFGIIIFILSKFKKFFSKKFRKVKPMLFSQPYTAPPLNQQMMNNTVNPAPQSNTVPIGTVPENNPNRVQDSTAVKNKSENNVTKNEKPDDNKNTPEKDKKKDSENKKS